MVNTQAIKRSRYYFSTSIDIVAFLSTHQLVFKGKIDAFESEDEGENGLFLNMFIYTVENGQCLCAIIKTIPRNAMYIYPDMQNKLIAAMSSVVTIDIKQEIGNSWYTIKVDGAKDPTGVENISTIIHFLQRQSLKVADRLLISSSNNSGDEKSITDVILAELTKTGLTSSKILSQVYDGASVMAGHCGGVQCLLQERENRKILYVHCLNHQLHLIVVHANLLEQAINDFLHVWGSLCSFFASRHLHSTIIVNTSKACFSRGEPAIWLQQQLFSILFNI